MYKNYNIKYVSIYLRKSRAEELTDTTEEVLRKHKQILMDLAKDRGYTILHIYLEVKSGESLSARPEMLSLLKNINGNDAILCMDIERLGRGSQQDSGLILDTFKDNDVKIVTPHKLYDLNDEQDEDYAEFETFMARKELKLIKRRMQRGKQFSIEQGCYMSNAPYGYEKITIDKKPTLKIKEDEAEIVRKIFDLYVNHGYGCQSIADHINLLGAKPRRSDKFCRTSVMHILKNTVFIGKIVWNKKSHIRKNTRGNSKHITIYNPPEKWTYTDGLHKPIISEELFNKAQEIIQGRYHPHTEHGTVKNSLTGICFCKICGATMTRRPHASKPDVLMCPNTGCNKATNLSRVLEKVKHILMEQFENINLSPAKQEIEDTYEKDIQIAKNEISKLEAQRNKTFDLLEQGIYTEAIFTERNSNIASRITELNNFIAELSKPKIKKVTALELKERIRNVLEVYDTASPAELNEMLRNIIKRIEYYKPKEAKPTEFNLDLELIDY